MLTKQLVQDCLRFNYLPLLAVFSILLGGPSASKVRCKYVFHHTGFWRGYHVMFVCYILLLRWARTSWNQSFNVVVIPSLGYCKQTYPARRVEWKAIVPFMSTHHVRRYWESIKRQFYKPSENYTPMIIVHSRSSFCMTAHAPKSTNNVHFITSHSFAWDKYFKEFVQFLLKMEVMQSSVHAILVYLYACALVPDFPFHPTCVPAPWLPRARRHRIRGRLQCSCNN